MKLLMRRKGLGVFCVALLSTLALAACMLHQAPLQHEVGGAATPADHTDGMYRLTEGQYRNTIADIFGPDIIAGGRFEPTSRRPHGLLAPGDYQIAVSPSGMEQFAAMARTIASQVVDEKQPDDRGVKGADCKPRSRIAQPCEEKRLAQRTCDVKEIVPKLQRPADQCECVNDRSRPEDQDNK